MEGGGGMGMNCCSLLRPMSWLGWLVLVLHAPVCVSWGGDGGGVSLCSVLLGGERGALEQGKALKLDWE